MSCGSRAGGLLVRAKTRTETKTRTISLARAARLFQNSWPSRLSASSFEKRTHNPPGASADAFAGRRQPLLDGAVHRARGTHLAPDCCQARVHDRAVP